MVKSHTGAKRRLERLQRVLDGRQTRLASAMARRPKRVEYVGPLTDLQRHGYSVALVLAAAAVLPTVAGLAWRWRKLLVGAALNALRIQKLRRQLDPLRDAMRPAGSDR